ncbi:MAG: hypothetical protein GY804_09310 [Alphaproteobacteria bacterium]|nr:hypothetical protein [Alphaproteobacteria bacterium]
MIYINYDLFIDAIYLLTHDNDAKTKSIIRDFIELFDKESSESDELASDTNILLAGVIKLLMVDGCDVTQGEANSILLKLLNSPEVYKEDASIIESLKSIVEPEENVTKCKNIKTALYNCIAWYQYKTKADKILKTVHRCRYTTNPLDQDDLLETIRNTAQSFEPREKVCENTSIIDEIDFDDDESIDKAFEAKEKRAVKNVFRVGWQGLQRMTGERNGFRIGETLCVYALSHNYKTALLLKFARWIACLNKPVVDEGKKPLLVFISLENELTDNLDHWYEELYLNLHGELPAKDLTKEEIKSFIKAEFKKNGWHFKIIRRLGVEFGYQEYCDYLTDQEKQGYQILAVINDYLGEMRMDTDNVPIGMFSNASRLVNHARYNGYFFATGAQLNHEAHGIVSGSSSNKVKLFHPGCIEYCKKLEQVFDFTMYQHLEYNLFDQRFITMKRGKHRNVDRTPLAHQYIAYMFDPKKGILDDIDLEDKSIRDIFAVPNPNENKNTDDSNGGSLFDNIF